MKYNKKKIGIVICIIIIALIIISIFFIKLKNKNTDDEQNKNESVVQNDKLPTDLPLTENPEISIITESEPK